MRHMSEPLTPAARFLHDAGGLALLAVVLIPLYMMFNDYWQSLILLVMFGTEFRTLEAAHPEIASSLAEAMQARAGEITVRA